MGGDADPGNRAIDLMRSLQRRAGLRDTIQREQEIFEQFENRSSLDAVASDELCTLVRDAMQKLSKDQREAIQLAFFPR